MKIDIAQLEFIDKKLREILLFVESKTGLEFTITSLYRMEDNGVHGSLPLRGTDLRVRNYDLGKLAEEIINTAYEYDNTRPEKNCAFLHGENSNMHLHVQVHPCTKPRR